MSSVYHILDKIPAIYPEDMPIEYETLTQILVNSGKLRVDTDIYRNFVIYNDANVNANLTISKEEFTDKKLIPITKKRFEEIYKNYYKTGQQLENKITQIFQKLNKEINNLSVPLPEQVVKLARIFVQSAHPIVIRWLFIDKVEVFLTYSYNIGDVMDIVSWKQSGSNSGMQSTDGKNVAIFVSSGGNPLFEDYKPNILSSDGWCAMARIQIIAAQELGHFADIKRDEHGRQISRHSTNFSGTRATEHTKHARKSDMERCNRLLKELRDNGLKNLTITETQLKFYRNNKLINFSVIKLKITLYFQRRRLINFGKTHHLLFVKKFIQDEHMGLMLEEMFEDMRLNLNPIADVYKRSDPEAEEAIACIEALARVPQQAIKYGHITAAILMHDLYKIYYREVIPSLIHNYQSITQSQYKPILSVPPKSFLYYIKKLNFFAKSRFTPIPIREIFNETNTSK